MAVRSVTRKTRTRKARRTLARLETVARVLIAICLLAIVAMVATLVLLTLAIYNQSRHDETAPADAIVVLGAAQWNGRPSEALRARLDHALDLYRQGLAPQIVLTGGSAEGDLFSEAEVGRNYLSVRGVPDSAMVSVAGRNSWESMQEASQVLLPESHRRVLLVSDGFHMFRIKHMADDLGLDPLASPTRTSPIAQRSPLEQRYIVREVFAYLAYLFVQR